MGRGRGVLRPSRGAALARLSRRRRLDRVLTRAGFPAFSDEVRDRQANCDNWGADEKLDLIRSRLESACTPTSNASWP